MRRVLVFKWGSGGWTVFGARRRVSAVCVRERSRPVRVCPRGAVPLGLVTKSVLPDVSCGRSFRVAGVGNLGRTSVCGGDGGRGLCVAAWDCGRMRALEKELGGGSRWQVWGIVRFDVAHAACVWEWWASPVARMWIRECRSVRFAVQAWGMQ